MTISQVSIRISLIALFFFPRLLWAACPPAGTPAIALEDFGGAADTSSVNNATAFNAALAQAKACGVREIQFRHGQYWFSSQPNDIDFGITLVGHGKGRTALYRHYNGTKGLLTFANGGNGSIVRDLSIVAAAGTTGGNAIRLVGTNVGSPDYTLFSNLYLSSEDDAHSEFDVTVYIDGTARNNGSGLIGVRDVEFDHCAVFGAANAGLVLDGVVAFNFIGGGLFGAGGATGKVVISGSNTMTSYYINIDASYIDGILMQRSENGNFKGYFTAPITTSSFSKNNIVIGQVLGGIQPFWVNGTHVDGGTVTP